MAGDLTPLILDLIEWIVQAPRSYAETLEAWHTSCPRLTVWEDAVEHVYVARRRGEDGHSVVEATAAGLRLLVESGRAPRGSAAARKPLSDRPRSS